MFFKALGVHLTPLATLHLRFAYLLPAHSRSSILLGLGAQSSNPVTLKCDLRPPAAP